MSWLARSIANSLKLDDDDEDENRNLRNDTDRKSQSNPESDHRQQTDSPSSPHSSSASSPTSRGVKEDLSELTKTLSRQFWGVASFLAPPPEVSPPHSQISGSKPSETSDESEIKEHLDEKSLEEDIIAGIRSDFAEISGKFKTGISKLSGHKTVSEITKIASNLLQFGSEEPLDKYEVGSVVGVNEEVLAFVRNIAMHPETWLDFPLPVDDESDDFELSDTQQEHALAVEHLAPRLAALRIELCPGYMSESCFWKIYFVLLHPRLNKHDALLLSTPHIMEARAMLTQELQNRNKTKLEVDLPRSIPTYSEGSAETSHEEHLLVPTMVQSEPVPLQTSAIESTSLASTDDETVKHPIQTTDIPIVDKPVIEERPLNSTNFQPSFSRSSEVLDEKYGDDGDDWLKEENHETYEAGESTIPIGNDEDVSFSDLEEEDDGEVPVSYKKMTSGSDSSSKDSRDWVQLSRGSTDSIKDINSTEIRHVASEQVNTRNPNTKESDDWLDVDDIDVM